MVQVMCQCTSVINCGVSTILYKALIIIETVELSFNSNNLILIISGHLKIVNTKYDCCDIRQ